MKWNRGASIDGFSGTFSFYVPPGLNSISSCLISWFHISLLAVDIPTLVKKNNLFINAWAYRLLLFWLHHGLPHAFPITCINIPHRVHRHGDRLSSYCTPRALRLITAAFVFSHFVVCTRSGSKLYLNKATFGATLICVRGLTLKRVRSFLWTLENYRSNKDAPWGSRCEPLALIEPVCEEKQWQLRAVFADFLNYLWFTGERINHGAHTYSLQLFPRSLYKPLFI